MSDTTVVPAPVTGWQASPVLVRIFSLHTLLFLLSAAAQICSRIPALAKWGDILSQVSMLLGGGGIVAAQAWQSPQVKAKLAAGDKPALTAGSIIAGQSARAWLPLLLVPLLALSACAGAKVWSACTLGQLPAVAQPLVPEIVNDLSGLTETTAIQQLEALGSSFAPGQFACIVQAIIADMAAKKSALSERDFLALHNGKAFLAKHPACCAVKP